MGLGIDLALVGSTVSACAGASIRARMREARRRARAATHGEKRIFMNYVITERGSGIKARGSQEVRPKSWAARVLSQEL